MELCSIIAGGTPCSMLESKPLKRSRHCVTVDVSFIYIDCRISYTCCQHRYLEARQGRELWPPQQTLSISNNQLIESINVFYMQQTAEFTCFLLITTLTKVNQHESKLLLLPSAPGRGFEKMEGPAFRAHTGPRLQMC